MASAEGKEMKPHHGALQGFEILMNKRQATDMASLSTKSVVPPWADSSALLPGVSCPDFSAAG